MDGGMRAWGAPDGSRRRPETTHGVLSCTRSSEQIYSTTKGTLNFIVIHGSMAQNGYMTDEEMTFTEVLL